MGPDQLTSSETKKLTHVYLHCFQYMKCPSSAGQGLQFSLYDVIDRKAHFNPLYLAI